MDKKETLDSVIVEVVRRELGNAKRMLTVLIIVTALLFASLVVNGILVGQLLSYETVTEQTVESYDISTDGDGNNFIAGDQYNDSAQHLDQRPEMVGDE